MTLEEKLTEMKECVKSESIYRPDKAMVSLSKAIEFCKEALQKQKDEYLSLVVDWDENTDKQGLYVAMDLMPEPTWDN